MDTGEAVTTPSMSPAGQNSAIEQLKQLQEQFEAQKRAILGKLEVEFNSCLVALKSSFDALPEDLKTGVFSQPDNSAVLKTMGLQVVLADAPKRRGRKPGVVTAKAATGRRGKRIKSKSGKSVAEMILEVLNKNGKSDIAAIMKGIKDTFGDEPKKTSISQTLNKLKKDEKIKNPRRGFYDIA